jgi:hypothetical protein
MVALIRERFAVRKPVTFPHLAEFVDTEMARDVAADTLRHYVHRLPEIKVIDGLAFEADRPIFQRFTLHHD